MDGTLLDTAPGILDSLHSAIIDSGASVPREKINNGLIGFSISEIVDLLGLGDDAERKNAIIANFRRIYDAYAADGANWYDFSRRFIDRLRGQGTQIFIATNKPCRATTAIVERLGIDFVTDIYFPDKYSDKTLKKTEMVAEIIKKYGLNPAETVVIGDTDVDFNAARENGCDFGFARHGYSLNAEFLEKNSDFVYGELTK